MYAVSVVSRDTCILSFFGCNYVFSEVFLEPLSTTAWRKLPLWEKISLVNTVALGSKSGYMYYEIFCDRVFYAYSRTL